MTGIISIKIRNTINYVNAFSSSADESAVEEALTSPMCVHFLCFVRIMLNRYIIFIYLTLILASCI